MMMKVIEAKKMNMEALESVNGGGIFDIISDFVTDIIEDPPFEVPDESGIGCFVSMITDKMIQIFSNNLYDTLVEEKKKQ